MLCNIMLSAVMLSTVMLSVIILCVEVPIKVTFNITTHSVISDTKQRILSEGKGSVQLTASLR